MKAIFLDKDGTLIEDVPYSVKPELIRFTAGADKALPLLHHAGYELIVVTNQPGLAKGLFTAESLMEVESRLRCMMAEVGVPLRAFYYCPHFPEGVIETYTKTCDCRKPEPGLLIQAAKQFRLNLNESWMIGDILDDVEAGNCAGCHTILINNGNETEWILTRNRMPRHVVSDLGEAARIVLASDENFTCRRRTIVPGQRRPRRRTNGRSTALFPLVAPPHDGRGIDS